MSTATFEPDAPVALAVADAAADDVAGRSLKRIAWDRLKKDRTFIVSSIVLIIIVLLALLAPLIVKLLHIDPYTLNTDAIDNSGGKPIGPWGGASVEHPLGVEWGTGRDILARLLYGLRVSLLIAVVSTILTTILGTVIGIVSGYVGGKTDAVIGRSMDLILAFPFFLIVLALSGSLTQRLTALGIPEGNPSRITYLILIFSIFGWPYLARIVRGQVLGMREREFVESAIAMGSGRGRILFKEILPNLWPPIIVYASLTLPTYIGLEAALSFLGVGLLPPEASFGAMLADSVQYFTLIPSYLFIPGTVLAIVVVTFNLAGDSIRDAIDPRGGMQ